MFSRLDTIPAVTDGQTDGRGHVDLAIRQRLLRRAGNKKLSYR